MSARISAPISVGELVDKITILELKARNISAPEKLANVKRELGLLRDLWEGLDVSRSELTPIVEALRAVNTSLWQVEDRLRAMEASGSFGEGFVEAARAVYRLNDQRAALKRDINLKLGSELMEEKSYHGDAQ